MAAIAPFMSTAPFAPSRRGSPALPRRDDVDMAGEGEVAAARRPLADGEEVLDRPVGRLAGHRAVDGEAERCELRFQAIEHQARGRRDARAGDQGFGQVEDGFGDLHLCATAYGL
jgi:hypothetical protein